MSVVVVLVEPQDLVNIAGVVRAMKNFGLRSLRLVSPAEYDPHRIGGIAHQSGDVLRRVALFERLDDAVADCTHVVGMTARQRSAKRNAQRPREAASELLQAADTGTAALLMGREDRGLTNEQLDRCHRVVTVPTDPDYAALNLAQAFTVMAYELYVAGGVAPFKPPRRRAAPATEAELEELFRAVEAGLRAIEFFKTHRPASIMRTVREIVHRVPLDAREVSLLRAMSLEVAHYLKRKGQG